MKIVNMRNFKVKLNSGVTKYYEGYSIMNEEGKFLSFDGKNIYIPVGGRKVLKHLLPTVDTCNFIELC